MFGLRAKGGNYAYATTRVKARKAFLFPRETYLKLLQMTVPEINRYIEESKYKQEIDELATRYRGIDLVEYALNLNLAREMNDILGFCQGDLKMMMGLISSGGTSGISSPCSGAKTAASPMMRSGRRSCPPARSGCRSSTSC